MECGTSVPQLPVPRFIGGESERSADALRGDSGAKAPHSKTELIELECMAKRLFFALFAGFVVFSLVSCTRLFNDCSNPRDAQVGKNYYAVLCPSSSFHFYDVVSGRLPAGIHLDGYFGSLSGTPSSGGIYRFKATVDDTLFGSQQDFSLLVRNPGTSPLFMGEQTATGRVGAPIAYTFMKTGGTAPFHFALLTGSIPPAVVLNADTGVLSGIPTASGSYGSIIEVSDSSSPVQKFSARFGAVISP